MDELHKIFFIDVYFGNMDHNQDDIIIQIEDDYHDMWFSIQRQNYNLVCNLYTHFWLHLKNNGFNKFLSVEYINYTKTLIQLLIWSVDRHLQ